LLIPPSTISAFTRMGERQDSLEGMEDSGAHRAALASTK